MIGAWILFKHLFVREIVHYSRSIESDSKRDQYHLPWFLEPVESVGCRTSELPLIFLVAEDCTAAGRVIRQYRSAPPILSFQVASLPCNLQAAKCKPTANLQLINVVISFQVTRLTSWRSRSLTTVRFSMRIYHSQSSNDVFLSAVATLYAVAFYWFLQVILGITLLPITLSKIKDLFTRKHVLKTRAHPFVTPIPDYIPKIKLISEEDQSIDRTLSLRNIFFAFSWILFLLLLIQLPKWHNREMTSFEPFDVLEIPKGSSESQIKRSYRKMSLKYHPDKCTKPPLELPEAKCKVCCHPLIVLNASNLLISVIGSSIK